MSHNEDRLIEKALSRLDDPEGWVDEESLSPEDERRLREYAELCALLPFALDPVTPSAQCRESILREIRGDSRRQPAPPLSFPPPRSTTSTWRPLQLLAAALSVFVLGLGASSAWLYVDNGRQTDRIEEIRIAVKEGQQREANLRAYLAEAERFHRRASKGRSDRSLFRPLPHSRRESLWELEMQCISEPVHASTTSRLFVDRTGTGGSDSAGARESTLISQNVPRRRRSTQIPILRDPG